MFLLWHRPSAVPRGASYGAVRFFVGLYFLLLLVSAFRSEPMMAGIFEFRRLIVPQIVAFLVTMRGVHSFQDVRRFFICLMALSLVMALFVFWDLFFDIWLLASDVLFRPEYGVNRNLGRYGSFFLNPNYLGAYVVLVFPAAFAWALTEKIGWAKLLGLMGLLGLVFCLVETQSRGPLLAFAIVVPVLLLGPAGPMSRTRRLAVFLPFVALFALFMPGFIEHAAERFVTIDQEMSTEYARTRETIWLYTKRAIADYPVAGIGFGEHQFSKVISEEYGFEEEYGETSLDNPHNSYLQMTVYAGYPALVSFLCANGLLLLRAARSIVRKLPGEQTPVAFGIATGIAGFLAVIYPDMYMFTQTVAPAYWMFVGLLLAMTTTVRSPLADRAAEVMWTERRAIAIAPPVVARSTK